METIKIKFYAFGANGYTDPRKRQGSNAICSDCSKKFSFWDDLQVSATDITLKCANCKGIEIDLITKSPLIKTEVIYETVLSVKEINSVEMILLVETKTKLFLVPLENEDNFYPKEDFCYEFYIERDENLSGAFKCFKMVTITADFILQHKDGIVLIKRKHEPFQGVLALPGGFVNEGEKPINAAIRELQEEVNIKVDIKSLKPVIVQSKPFRDPRNKWTTAHVFTAKVDDLSSIKAGDDAESYVITPIKELFKEKLAFDHLESIEYCLWPDTKDILDADSKALHIYLQMGHSKKEALDAFIKIFNLPEMSKRYEALRKHIED